MTLVRITQVLSVLIQCIFCVVALCTTVRGSMHDAATEYQVKAAYLFNFIQFIQWPKSERLAPGAEVKICILGSDPFGRDIDELVRGERFEGKLLRIIRLNRVEDAKSCLEVFVSASEGQRMTKITDALSQLGVLSVGDTPDFIEKGGAIQFIVDGGRVKFIINLSAIEKAELRVSSKLLKLAKVR